MMAKRQKRNAEHLCGGLAPVAQPLSGCRLACLLDTGSMQIIESSVIGVRSSVLRLTRAGSPLEFRFFPMVHVGEPAFYAAVTDRLRRCDLVVAEGVGGTATPEGRVSSPSPTVGSVAASALTASYRLPARFGRTGLVEQNIPYATLGVPVRYPDMTDEQFSTGWRAVPAWQRALALGLSPLAGLDRMLFGSRRELARQLSCDDLDWQDELLDVDSMDDLLALLGEKRDQLLITELDRIHREHVEESVTVGVVYGAAHTAPAVHGMRTLHRYGIRSAEWLTVFSL
jgi:hypothetical protein